MNPQHEATEYLIWLEKYGKKYTSNLMDSDCRQLVEHKKVLFFNKKVISVSVTEELTKQILNRKQINSIATDLKNYCEAYSNNKIVTRKGGVKEIDSEKDYNISTASGLVSMAKKIEKIYLAKKDDKQFDDKVANFVKILNKSVVYEDEQFGFDTMQYMKVEKPNDKDVYFCIDFQIDMDKELQNNKPKPTVKTNDVKHELDVKTL